MKFSVATPLAIVLDAADVAHVRAEDATGAFGVLPGHADFLTSLNVSVVNWRDVHGKEHYIAVRGGMFEVRNGDTIAIAAPEAVVSDDLEQLESAVLARFRREQDAERSARTELQRLYLAAVRQMYRFLRQERRTSLVDSGADALLEEFQP